MATVLVTPVLMNTQLMCQLPCLGTHVRTEAIVVGGGKNRKKFTPTGKISKQTILEMKQYLIQN